MKRSEHIANRIGVIDLWMTVAATALATLLIVAAPSAHAQTFTVVHNFTGSDGANPWAGLTLDRAGNLYGTTAYGGNGAPPCDPSGCGTVFKLTHRGSGWVLSELYEFAGGADGATPLARVVFGPNGILYGTTLSTTPYVATVFDLRPPATVCRSVSCPWTKSVLFSFDAATGYSLTGDLTFDATGNIYGTTQYGGSGGCNTNGCGVLYELTQSGGSWAENILYNFTGAADGGHPSSGVIFDQAGNLYGTAPSDSYDDNSLGLVFEFTPSSSGWTESVLYYFTLAGNGGGPYGGLTFDLAGNLYGTTVGGGSGNVGTVFQLSPSGNNWNWNRLYSFPRGGSGGPYATLVRDSAGNLYGTTEADGEYGYGNVFELTPSNGGWIYTDLHDFTGATDGGNPYSSLVLDSSGNLYGTAYQGGQNNGGVVFEITP